MCGCNKKTRQIILNIQKQRRQALNKINEISDNSNKEKNNNSNKINSFRLLNPKLPSSANLKSR